MKKPMPPKPSKKSGRGPRPLPENLSHAAAQAVLEDAVMVAAADIAAMSATLDERTGALTPEADVLVGAILPETPEEQELLELIGVPLLGPARISALAALGILTLDDLHAAPPEQIAGIKGVGPGNARRIKDWVAQRPRPEVSAPAAQTPPPTEEAPPAVTPSSGPDPALGNANEDIYETLGALDGAIERLTARLGPPDRAKRLRRQLDRVSTVASELAEGPDVLTTDGVRQAVRLLGQITPLLEAAVSEKKLTEKRLDALCDVLRPLRKSLQKIIEG